MTDAILEDGKAAWNRLRSRERQTYADWIALGRAIVAGRTVALKLAKTNKPLQQRALGALAG